MINQFKGFGESHPCCQRAHPARSRVLTAGGRFHSLLTMVDFTAELRVSGCGRAVAELFTGAS